ncbi:hypothetical protein [Shewanella waksmanii]|uniref:hypothetical protein n=1 Tax=Shewanella waksmanii TaxID=213783 RepID=UPI0004907D78|nr:hypothetical protein [Shewanella waksmanii]
MKKSLTSVALISLLTATSAFANEEAAKEEVNYGDPTASFTTVGVSASKDVTQLNGMMGLGSNIFQLDISRNNKSGDLSGRGRYFHVTDGLGYSVDVIGDENNQTVLGGLIYKFQVTDNISIFPMLSAGGTQNKRIGEKDKYDRSGLAQAGVYAMYGFDAGHWLYVNPKTTYHFKDKTFTNQVEVGGGFMLLDNVSVGAKVEYTGEVKNKHGFNMPEDTVTWIQANYYF